MKKVRNFQIWVKSFKKKKKKFGKDFSVKSREKKKLKKTKNPIFPEKKMIFLFFFFNSYFFMENRQIDPKRVKSGKHMSLRPIYNFCEKKKIYFEDFKVC